MISVIIITYNRVNLLKIAIDSVLIQLYNDFEVIIIDDGSTDETAKMIAEYVNPRIKYFYTNHIGQLSKIRNIGLRNATGDIIAFLDSDDFWHPDYLIELYRIYTNQAIMSTICNAFIFDENQTKSLFNLNKLPKSNSIILEHRLSNHQPIIYPSCFSFLRNSNQYFNEEMNWGDNDLFLRVLALGNTAIITKELVFIRKHDSNMTNNQTEDSLFIQAYNEEFMTLDYFKKNNIIGELIYRKTYSNFLSKQAANFMTIGMRSKAWLGYLHAFLKYPLNLKSFARLFLFYKYL